MPVIVDQYGTPVRTKKAQRLEPSAGWGLYQTPRNTGTSDYYRPRQTGLTDLAGQLSTFDWQEILQFSRELVSQLPNLGYAVLQKNQYAVGDAWIPQYAGQNPKWGDESEEWLQNVFCPNCNLMGGCSDWSTDLLLSAISWDVDGDDLAIFVIDEDEMPKLTYRSAHQIGSGGSGNEVKGGPFDGAKINNGVICDRSGRFLGVRVLKDRKQKEDSQYEDIPAANCDFRYEPVWRTQYRGIPRPASAILDQLDVQDIKVFLKRAVKLESSIGLIHYNEGGEADPNADFIDERVDTDTDPNAQATDIKIEKRLGGEITYMRANLGERLEGLKTDRPASNTMEFLQGLERNGLLALGWFYELLDPSKLGGASVRMIQDEARHSIASRQKTLKKRALRAVQFAVAQAMRRGDIRNNPDPSDWMKWNFGLPAQLTVDAGYDEQADRENIVLGTATLDSVCQKKGRWWEETRAQRQKENADLIRRAKELMAEANVGITEPSEKLTLREALSLMQGSSNMPENLRADMSRAGNTQE